MRSLLFTVVVVLLITVSYGQRVNPKDAAILQEARYLSGDGSFGAAYIQDDGVEFKEETDAEGTRKGSYSYYDPTGMKTTVHYTAGKNGFEVTGDHIPKAPLPAPVHQQAPKRQQYRPEYQSPPVPQYNPQPQYNSIQNQPSNNGQFSYNYNNNQFAPNQQYPTTTTTTPSPRFFPPGKLNLNRTPDGYQYSFSST